jgi:rhodanese-related sulfurtransferase
VATTKSIRASRRRRKGSASSPSSTTTTTTTTVMASSTGLFDCPIFAEKALEKFQQSTSSTTKASTEEARVLFENNFIILDCRAHDEIAYEGRCSGKPNVIEVPLINAKRVYDAEAGKKVYKQERVNAETFVSSVTAKAGGSKDTNIMIMDSVGGIRAEKAFEILSSNGFSSLVLVNGGVNAWKAAWDANMRRRQLPGSFSRGFDNAMFSDSMVSHAETFGSAGDETVWVI